MINPVFTYDFARRCRALLHDLEPVARTTHAPETGGPLTTTFAIAMAMPLIVVPIERLGTYNRAAGHDRSRLPTMYGKLDAELAKPFSAAKFRGGAAWALVTCPEPVNGPSDWQGRVVSAGGLFADVHRQAIDDTLGKEVLNGLRCALAHGSVAYLDRDGKYTPGAEAEVVALFATKREKDRPPVVQIYAVHQDHFLTFLDDWACFLDEIRGDEAIDPPPIQEAA